MTHEYLGPEPETTDTPDPLPAERVESSPATDVHPDVERAVRDAEAAAQRSVCEIPEGELPDELAEALRLRTETNLATTGGQPLQACGASHPEVAWLEAPYRKPRAVVTGVPDDEQPPGSLDPANTEEE